MMRLSLFCMALLTLVGCVQSPSSRTAAAPAQPQQPGQEVKLLYASQIGIAPPTFAIVTNRPDDVPESYQRYLANGFREAWPFTGAPVRLRFTSRGARR